MAHTPEEASETFRERRERFKRGNSDEIDIDDLIGARGTKLSMTPEQVEAWRQSSYYPRPAHETQNLVLTGNSREILENFNMDDGEMLESGAERVIGLMARRLGRLAARPFLLTVNRMVEPVRTVAINCLLLGVSGEEAARAFETSIETIDFLVEVALNQLETSIEFHTPQQPLAAHLPSTAEADQGLAW